MFSESNEVKLWSQGFSSFTLRTEKDQTTSRPGHQQPVVQMPSREFQVGRVQEEGDASCDMDDMKVVVLGIPKKAFGMLSKMGGNKGAWHSDLVTQEPVSSLEKF